VSTTTQRIRAGIAVLLVAIALPIVVSFYQWYYLQRPYTNFHQQIAHLTASLPIGHLTLQDGIFDDPTASYAQLPSTAQTNATALIAAPPSSICPRLTANLHHVIATYPPTAITTHPGPPAKNGSMVYSPAVACAGAVAIGAPDPNQAGVSSLAYTLWPSGPHHSVLYIVAIATAGPTHRTNPLPALRQ
jgi:hypothetical protein